MTEMQVITGGWLCALLLCFTGTATGQSVSGNVSATENAAEASQVESSVSTSVASTAGSAANTSGSGSRSAAALNLLAGTKSPAGSPHELYGTRHAETRYGLKTSLMAGSGIHQKAAGSGNRSRAGGATPAASQRKAPGLAGPQSSAGGGAVSGSSEGFISGSEGFPDSTRGTAQLSPPDPGTSSPLDWTSNGLSFEFPDFSEGQFLTPSLQAQIGGKRHRRGQILSGHGKIAGQVPSGLSIEQSLEPDILSNKTLTPDILNQSSPPTIEQQIGLPQ